MAPETWLREPFTKVRWVFLPLTFFPALLPLKHPWKSAKLDGRREITSIKTHWCMWHLKIIIFLQCAIQIIIFLFVQWLEQGLLYLVPIIMVCPGCQALVDLAIDHLQGSPAGSCRLQASGLGQSHSALWHQGGYADSHKNVCAAVPEEAVQCSNEVVWITGSWFISVCTAPSVPLTDPGASPCGSASCSVTPPLGDYNRLSFQW